MSRVQIALLVLGLLAILLPAALLIYGLQEDLTPSDVGIVLGSKVRADGQPSSSLASRLDRAKALYDEKRFANIIVTGGPDKENGLIEAEVMRDYLIARGIPNVVIFAERQAKDTRENAKFSVAIMRAKGWQSAMIITEAGHLFRARLAFKRAGLERLHYASSFQFGIGTLRVGLREVVASGAALFGK